MNTVGIMNAYDLIMGKLKTWIDVAIAMLPNLVVALLIMIVFYVAAKSVKKLVDKLLGKVTDNLTIIHLIGSVISISVAGIGLFIALSVLQLDDTVKTLLAGAGIIGLALGFAFPGHRLEFHFRGYIFLFVIHLVSMILLKRMIFMVRLKN